MKAQGSRVARHLARVSPEVMTSVAKRFRAIMRYSGSVRLRAASAGIAARRTAEPGVARSAPRLRSAWDMLLIVHARRCL
eukprot:13699398-Alexandrium_andersonii.AAC.1